MKKLFVLLLTVAMLVALVACKPGQNNPPAGDNGNNGQTPPELTVMTYEEYMAAEIQSEVLVEMYVQAHQSWWDNKITVYGADADGAYFVYELACSEEDAAKLLPGTKIRVHGYKAEWAGEIEIMDATFEFVEGDSYIADPVDLTALLGSEDLIDYQNQLAYFDSLTVVKIEYKNGAPGDDIYLTVSRDGAEYSFCVEAYLTSPDSDVYKAVCELQPGDVIHIDSFLYWYNGVNPHIVAIYNGGVLSYEEYSNAKLNQHVKVEVYVQAHQSWWDNKITVYAADENGGYFLYNMACSEEDAAKLVPGTKILVDGYKTAWEGEVEIIDATFEFVEGDSYIADAIDLTAKLGTEELISYQNQLAAFKGLTVVNVEYQGGNPGKDIYLTLSLDGVEHSFCVESYLTFPDSDVYKAVCELQVGDVVDVEGFLYWYINSQPHIVNIIVH